MCGGMSFEWEGQRRTVYFPQPEPEVPVRGKRGENLVLWGRREKETATSLPTGGWARFESLEQGKWDQWSPAPVAILAEEYMEKNNHSYWFSTPGKEAIAGVGLKENGSGRVYVVTRQATEPYRKIHDRWPCFRKPEEALTQWWTS